MENRYVRYGSWGKRGFGYEAASGKCVGKMGGRGSGEKGRDDDGIPGT